MTGIFMLGAFFLAVAFAMVIALLYAALAGVFAALIIVGATKLFAWNSRFNFGTAYKAAFGGILAYILVSFVLEQIFHGTESAWQLISAFLNSPGLWELEKQTWFGLRHYGPAIIATHIPGITCCALVIMKVVGYPYRDISGFLKALLASIVAIVFSFTCVAVIFAFGGAYISTSITQAGGLEQYGTSLIDGLASFIWHAVILLIYAAIAAVIGGVLVSWMKKRWLMQPPAPYGKNYGTAFLGIMSYGLTVLLVDGLFRQGVGLDSLTLALVSSSGAIPFWQRIAMNVLHQPVGPLFVNVLGLLAATWVFSTSLSLQKGVLGFAKSGLAGLVVLSASFICCTALGYMVYARSVTSF